VEHDRERAHQVDRPFTWTITKTAADPVVDLNKGQTATENYTVKVNRDSRLRHRTGRSTAT
jgi:hypothetical protein